MTVSQELDFWTRFQVASGRSGGVAFLLVLLASVIHGNFDWMVFLIAGAAVFIAWSRSWMLVPDHLRNQDQEDAMWNRFFESDWRFVDSISGLNGTELDELKARFKAGDDAAVRAFVRRRWTFEGEEMQPFLIFFSNTFSGTVSAYIDDSGRLRPFD